MKETIINSFYQVGSSYLGQKMSSNFKGDASIFMYHRVLPDKEAKNDRSSLSISLSQFEKQIQYLSQNYSCISMDDLHQNKSWEKFPVCITFDDGYKDNVDYALPILKKYQVPATIYFVSDYLHGKCTMWWYEILEILDKKTFLKFKWENQRYFFNTTIPQKKLETYKALRRIIMNLRPEKLEVFLDLLREGKDAKNYAELVIDKNLLKTISQEKLITIGAHTCSHPVLATLDEDEIEKEIVQSKKILEDIIQKEIHHFAYPYGDHNSAGTREYKLASKLGFKTIVTTNCFPLKFNSCDMAALPRITMKNRTAPTHIKAKVNGWNSLFRGVQI